MTERCAAVFGTAHITCNVMSQRILDSTTEKDMAIRVGQAFKGDDELRKASEVVPPWEKFDEVKVPSVARVRTPQPPPVGDGRWVQMAQARRDAADAALGPKADMPKPLIKLRGRTPRTPPAEESLTWGREARDLDQRALVRVLHDLKARLGKEQKLRESAEAKLARSGRSRSETPLLPNGTRSMSSSFFDAMDPSRKAMSLSLARSSGLYLNDAAGILAKDRLNEMFERAPTQRPKRTRPFTGGGCPYATVEVT
eukprot:TRINITY_DN49959_c0_g1_i1.p1 TRINITY_DN49959_c0_g1~~TRINITY_DN49959_c0_g1_i1.p1  ORF type:complete len:255 (-),score=42.69 TRINITY_DN49959_c0_g1_i1:74-838(-)